MTFEEWYAGADELGFAPEIGTAAYLLLRDAWTVSARIERERCAALTVLLPVIGPQTGVWAAQERAIEAYREAIRTEK
ncbi:MAG: hypothetical protein K2X91_01470 [Thermoleophilia bacterium]|nr:hypothetical protein [Thermoleophilia bacterium]